MSLTRGKLVDKCNVLLPFCCCLGASRDLTTNSVLDFLGKFRAGRNHLITAGVNVHFYLARKLNRNKISVNMFSFVPLHNVSLLC